MYKVTAMLQVVDIVKLWDVRLESLEIWCTHHQISKRTFFLLELYNPLLGYLGSVGSYNF